MKVEIFIINENRLPLAKAAAYINTITEENSVKILSVKKSSSFTCRVKLLCSGSSLLFHLGIHTQRGGKE